MIRKVKVVHIGITIFILCIVAIITNNYLHIKYAAAFEAEEKHVEDGKSDLLVSKDGLYNYRIDESSGTVEIISYNIEIEPEIEIPKEIDGRTVTSIGETTFAYHIELKTIYIPETITTIRLAFVAGCHNLEEIIFEGDVDEIEEYAFSDFNGKVIAPEYSNIYSYAKNNGVQVETVDTKE